MLKLAHSIPADHGESCTRLSSIEGYQDHDKTLVNLLIAHIAVLLGTLGIVQRVLGRNYTCDCSPTFVGREILWQNNLPCIVHFDTQHTMLAAQVSGSPPRRPRTHSAAQVVNGLQCTPSEIPLV